MTHIPLICCSADSLFLQLHTIQELLLHCSCRKYFNKKSPNITEEVKQEKVFVNMVQKFPLKGSGDDDKHDDDDDDNNNNLVFKGYAT
jgi:hypothetical protein